MQSTKLMELPEWKRKSVEMWVDHLLVQPGVEEKIADAKKDYRNLPGLIVDHSFTNNGNTWKMREVDPEDAPEAAKLAIEIADFLNQHRDSKGGIQWHLMYEKF